MSVEAVAVAFPVHVGQGRQLLKRFPRRRPLHCLSDVEYVLAQRRYAVVVDNDDAGFGVFKPGLSLSHVTKALACGLHCSHILFLRRLRFAHFLDGKVVGGCFVLVALFAEGVGFGLGLADGEFRISKG